MKRCDRILIWSNETHIVKQRYYKRCEYTFSDHKFLFLLNYLIFNKRPVCSYYIVTVKKINQEKKKEILRQISLTVFLII